MAKSGGAKDGKIFIYQDDAIRGFQLRVQGRLATWIVRTPSKTVTIGYAWPQDDAKRPYIGSISKVRDLASAVVRYLDDGKADWTKQLVSTYHRAAAASSAKNDKQLIKSVLAELEAAINAPPPSPDDLDAWTFKDCVDKYLDLKTSPDAKKKIKIKGEKSESDIRTTFGRPCFQSVMKMKVLDVTSKDIERVRDQVYIEKGASPSNKVIAYTRAMLKFCWRHASESGLQSTNRWWEILAEIHEVLPRTRQPTIEEVVKTMILAEQFLDKPYPGRCFSTPGTKAGTLAALWWIVLTCQRVEAGLSILSENIVEDQERQGEGWLIAAWDGPMMKNKKSFILPIPQRAWDFVDGFRQRAKQVESPWAFPSERKPAVHASSSGTYGILGSLGNRKKPEQKNSNKKKKAEDRSSTDRKWTPPVRTEARDLLTENNIDWWSHHDLRNLLAAEMTKKRMPGGASAILAHEVEDDTRFNATDAAKKRLDFQMQRAALITQKAYGAKSQFIELKSLAMEEWTNAILDEYDRQKGNIVPFMEAAE